MIERSPRWMRVARPARWREAPMLLARAAPPRAVARRRAVLGCALRDNFVAAPRTFPRNAIRSAPATTISRRAQRIFLFATTRRACARPAARRAIGDAVR